MGRGFSAWDVFFFITNLVLIATPAANGSVCSDVVERLLPCQGFLLGTAELTVPCCESAKGLTQMANTQSMLQSICGCLKQAAMSANVNLGRAKQLPFLCSLNLPLPIDPNVNCQTIKLPGHGASMMNKYKIDEEDQTKKTINQGERSVATVGEMAPPGTPAPPPPPLPRT